MKLQNLDTSRFLFDPKDANFVKKMHSDSKEFYLRTDQVSEKKAFTYLTLMYDPTSELRIRHKDLYERKNIAAQVAEFPTKENKHKQFVFYHSYEDLMIGENERFNMAVAHYLFKTYNIDYIEHILLEYQYKKLFIESFKSYDNRTNDLLKDIKDRLLNSDMKLLGGHEDSVKLREALYAKSDKERVNYLMPENVLDQYHKDGLKEFNPYGEDYNVGDLTYVSKE
jgi:hypothetical protein